MQALATLISDTMATGDLTLEQVARKSGLSIATIGAYKNGKRGAHRPPRDTVRKIATALGHGADPTPFFVAAGLAPDEQGSDQLEKVLLSLYRQLPTQGDKEQAVDQLRAHVRAASKRSPLRSVK